MTTIEKLNYCLGIWIFNHERFLDFEIEYYMGLTNKKPHGIHDSYWQLAYKIFSNIGD